MLDLDKLTGHTPGKWTAWPGKYGYQIHAGNRWLANMKCESVPTQEQANARLVAAAPELLEMARKYEKALRLCLNYIENTESEIGIKLPCGDAARETLGEHNV